MSRRGVGGDENVRGYGDCGDGDGLSLALMGIVVDGRFDLVRSWSLSLGWDC